LHIERRLDKSAGPGTVAIIETKIVNRLACVDDF